jgi:hypothetical protein
MINKDIVYKKINGVIYIDMIRMDIKLFLEFKDKLLNSIKMDIV